MTLLAPSIHYCHMYKHHDKNVGVIMKTSRYPFFWLILLSYCSFLWVTSLEMKKRILVTGGNKGIGKAVCQRLLEHYEHVHVILASRDATRGHQAVTDIVQALGEGYRDRLEMLLLDVTCDESVQQAAATLAARAQQDGSSLYGIVNNAGIIRGSSTAQVVQVNYFGSKRVVKAFGPQLQVPGGRIVNIASASGPFFLQDLRHNDKALYTKLAQPWTCTLTELDQMAQHPTAAADNDPYGFSKALVNAYTFLLARQHEQDWIVNSVTPGWIQTDMTAGQGATNPPSKGAIPPVWCLMDQETLEHVPSGRYYGSDCVRSPLHVYRGPGDAPYEGPDGTEEQEELARKSTLPKSK